MPVDLTVRQLQAKTGMPHVKIPFPPTIFPVKHAGLVPQRRLSEYHDLGSQTLKGPEEITYYTCHIVLNLKN